MTTYRRKDTPRAIVQRSTQATPDPYHRFFQIIEGVVTATYFVDQYDNLSAAHKSDGGVAGSGAEVVAARALGENPAAYADIRGTRIECDVYMLRSTRLGNGYQTLKNVPVLQLGGMHDIDLWVPKPCTNFTYEVPVQTDPANLDGDVVIIGFIAGVFPQGAIILGAYPHKRNYLDHPRTYLGDQDYPKSSGDGKRKDGFVRFSRQNGTVRVIDRTGNLVIDTTEANRLDLVDANTGERTSTQDFVTSTDADTPNPGGGDVTLRVKNVRKLRVEFTDNSVMIQDYNVANPRRFQETGFIEVTQSDPTTRTIDIEMSDDVIINVRKIGNGEGKILLNAEKAIEGITLGADSLQRFATRDFVEQIFLEHTHMTGVGMSGTPLVDLLPVGIPNSSTGIVMPQNAKVITTKVQGE